MSGPEPSNASQSSKHIRNLNDLEHEFGRGSIRKNEGEAANYGIFFDDSKYDYMQHLRELGTGVGSSHFVEPSQKGKGKKGMKLEDALRETSLDNESESNYGGPGSVYGSEAFSTTSSYARPQTYQDQQEVPDAIAGFQPDMDPRLREALEALEDDAFVDDEDDEDVFGELTNHAEEVEPGVWEDTLFDQDDEDDGWESDATEKAPVQRGTTELASEGYSDAGPQKAPGELPSDNEPIPDLHPEDQGWMREFAKFKKDIKAKGPPAAPSAAPSEQRSALASTIFTVGGTPVRTKKRKGALTNPSAYSMTSSSLARTDGHKLLDDRFEKVEQLYALDEEDEYDDNMSMASGMTGATGMSAASSQAPSLVDADGAVPSGFNNIMDDFLAGWDGNTGAQAKRKGAKAKRGKNGNEAAGMRMLDEIRQGLGPAKVQGKVPGRA